jgi:hypothetical protein
MVLNVGTFTSEDVGAARGGSAERLVVVGD